MQYGDLHISGIVLSTLIVCMTALAVYIIQTFAPVRKTNASTRFWTGVLPSIKDMIIALFKKNDKD